MAPSKSPSKPDAAKPARKRPVRKAEGAEKPIATPAVRKPRTTKPKAETSAKPKKFHERVTDELALDKAERENKPFGRPSEFTEERFQSIIERVACGESVRSICRDEEMPSRQTFFIWLYKMPHLVDRYTHAKDISTYSDEDDLTEIADDGSNDWMERRGKDGEVEGYRFNGEAAARSRLRVDTRRFLMERRMPQRFGNKVDVNHGIQPDNPIATLLERVSGSSFKPTKEGDE